MKAADWKLKHLEQAKLAREIRDTVTRTYLVPSFHEEAPISTAIAIRAGDMATVDVFPVHSGGAVRQGLVSSIERVESLDVFALEALARTKREVELWYQGERDELPTAEELKLIDAATYDGSRFVIGQSDSHVPALKEKKPTIVHEVDGDTRLPPKGGRDAKP
jgi:hypothetical protein